MRKTALKLLCLIAHMRAWVVIPQHRLRAVAPKRQWLLSTLASFVLLLNACSTSRSMQVASSPQEQLLQKMTRLREAIKANPNNSAAIRDYGIGLYELKKYKYAALVLEKSLREVPNQGLALLVLGLTYEQLRRWDEAVALYRAYDKIPNKEYRQLLRGRLELAIQGKLREEARRALAAEGNLAPSRLPENSLAVFKFQDLGSSAEMAPLATGLADMVITDLSQVQSLTVVERYRLQALMEEMGLGQSGLVDEATAPRVGNLLGARKILQGSFLQEKGQQLRLDANLADVVLAKAKNAGQASGELARFFRLEKDLVFKVIHELGIQLSEAEEKAILTIPTENLLAFLAYARGLEARDRGEYETAAREFQNAVKADSKFARAQTQLERTQSMRQALASPNAPLQTLGFNGQLAAQQRRMHMAQATLHSNPGFSFVNQGRVSLLAPRNTLPGGNNSLRQPLLEGRADFGLPGEIRLDLKLP